MIASAPARRRLICPRVGRLRALTARKVALGSRAVDDGLINVADFERLAEELMEPGPHGYFAGGAGDEVTLRENREAWRRWRLRPRMLVDVSAVSTATRVLGSELSMPILVAPVAYQRLVDEEGEPAMARAAAAAGTAMCLSTLATTLPGEVAAAAPGGRHWFQLYCFRDEGVTRALTEEAVGAGFEAIVVTADAPRGGRRERDLRTGFRLPAELGVPSVQAALGASRAVTIEETFDLMDPALSWASLERLAADSEVPVLVKGVLTAEDAQLALEHGAGGVVVSNHGGRQLDGSRSAFDQLAEIVDAVGDRIDVMMDGGVQRGTHVLKALSMGAKAVGLGRYYLFPLAAAGQAGVERALGNMQIEIERAMRLMGVGRIGELSRDNLKIR